MANISQESDWRPTRPDKNDTALPIHQLIFSFASAGGIGESRYAICSALLQRKATTEIFFVHCKAVPYFGI